MSVWDVLAWAGQACFFSRFLIQWLASERARRSVAPVVFWWLSLAGSVLLGSKTIADGDAVLTPGYLVNGSIYLRNIFLLQDLPSSTSTFCSICLRLSALKLAEDGETCCFHAAPMVSYV